MVTDTTTSTTVESAENHTKAAVRSAIRTWGVYALLASGLVAVFSLYTVTYQALLASGEWAAAGDLWGTVFQTLFFAPMAADVGVFAAYAHHKATGAEHDYADVAFLFAGLTTASGAIFALIEVLL